AEPLEVRLPNPGGVVESDIATHEQLDAILWTRSAEYRAAVRQAFNTAAAQLATALEDRSWTALPEQRKAGNYGALPTAVMVNLDETVLSNFPYQQRIVFEHGQYRYATFAEWSQESRCMAMPGAVRFLAELVDRGVSIVYFTIRPESLRPGTVENLKRLGYPLRPETDRVLMQDRSYATQEYRNELSRTHRVLLVIGDNLDDFSSGGSWGRSRHERRAVVTGHADYFGSKWIVVPNPMYGFWKDALVDYRISAARESKIEQKAVALMNGD
ncbi:MAG: HAD family acid phosphatase, partial [Planctomycetota bacterium]